MAERPESGTEKRDRAGRPRSESPGPQRQEVDRQGTERRRAGLRALGETIPLITRRAMGRRGLAEGGLVHDWQEIVGREIAAVSLPIRLSFPRRERRAEGTLTLRVAPGYGVLLQHVEPQIRERVNGYLGYAAVAQLRLQQAPLPLATETRPAASGPLPPAVEARLQSLAETIDDEPLRKALERLGRAVMGKVEDNTKS